MTNAVCCQPPFMPWVMQTPGRHQVAIVANEDSVKYVIFGAVNSCLVRMACCV
jgi:hypothetical protein